MALERTYPAGFVEQAIAKDELQDEGFTVDRARRQCAAGLEVGAEGDGEAGCPAGNDNQGYFLSENTRSAIGVGCEGQRLILRWRQRKYITKSQVAADIDWRCRTDIELVELPARPFLQIRELIS